MTFVYANLVSCGKQYLNCLLSTTGKKKKKGSCTLERGLPCSLRVMNLLSELK